MNKLNKNREYQNKQVEEDLYQFEMGNELGAQLERNKDMHEQEYQKQSINQNLDSCRNQNQKQDQMNKTNRSNNNYNQ